MRKSLNNSVIKYSLWMMVIIVAGVAYFFTVKKEGYKTVVIHTISMVDDSIHFEVLDNIIFTNNREQLRGESVSILETKFARNEWYQQASCASPDVFVFDSIPAKYYDVVYLDKKIRSYYHHGYFEELKLQEEKEDTVHIDVYMYGE